MSEERRSVDGGGDALADGKDITTESLIPFFLRRDADLRSRFILDGFFAGEAVSGSAVLPPPTTPPTGTLMIGMVVVVAGWFLLSEEDADGVVVVDVAAGFLRLKGAIVCEYQAGRCPSTALYCLTSASDRAWRV